MKRLGMALVAALLLYVASGLFIVKGNEKAVVRRFGRLTMTSAQETVLYSSGLHIDLPWPFVTIDRVNLNEVRTLTIGTAVQDDFDGGGFLRSPSSAYASQFLTGDKNILNLQINVQYRISEKQIAEYLFASQSPERRLKLLVESAVADLVSRSGVDFVHPLGLGRLREMLTARAQQLATLYRLGIEVDEVSISSVAPPVQVKADFLDVANARADRQRFVNSANAYAVERKQAARAERRQTLDQAEIYRQQTVESARGAAYRFTKLIGQFEGDSSQGPQTVSQARQMAMQRLYVETMKEVLGKAAGKVLLDSGEEVDLTIIRAPQK